ncbi:MAG TPA: dihydrodipicolinate synthase family protein [Candidatus Acidoferrales bacterium]|nr:dihydrodipicolinate synthase family protein [Candidatus Acidoferrales bacterium]
MKSARAHLTTGVLAATLTPLGADGVPDAAMLAEHCRGLLAQGCTSIVLLGTTGEANSFTVAERRSTLESLLDAGFASDDLIVGTGCCAAGDTLALTRHALSVGVARVLVLPPFYYKKVTDEGVFAAYARVLESIADDRLRVYMYLIPQLSGVEIGAEFIARLLDAFPQQIAGLKDSSGDWAGTEKLCRQLGGRLDVLVGSESFLLRALEAGASGCVSATANVNAADIARLYARRTDRSASLEQRVNATRAAFERYPMVAALKAFMAARTGNALWNNVRSPLEPLKPEEGRELMAAVAQLARA